MEETSLYYLLQHVLTFHVSHSVLQNKILSLQYTSSKSIMSARLKRLGNTEKKHACLTQPERTITHTRVITLRKIFLSNLHDGSGLVDDRNNI
jgi:hypothetical protein